jgi:(1->4)-alpha-D-glucan 1-alpha-D-glucosylmutase
MNEITRDCVDRMLRSEARAPRSTYRVQMNAGFTFADAEKIFPYLKQLGIGDLYTSPIFEARPGSSHGYDVARHDRFNPELGGNDGFAHFSQNLRETGLGLLLDIVPNHMGVGNDSVWWQDVLENGRSSEYADFFDIDWTPLKPDMQGKLLLPILGKQYGEELENKQIQFEIHNDAIRVRYFEYLMPVAPRSLPIIFPESEWDELQLPTSFRNLLRDLSHIPPHDTPDANLAAQRREQLKELKPRLHEAIGDPALRPIVERVIERANGVKGDASSFDRMHEVLEAQPYRLALWRVSTEEINYRRFFDINDLVGLRMENPAVFAATHCLIRRMLAAGEVNGLRIDHADGMFNPRQYLIRLQMLYVASQCAGPTPIEPTTASAIEVDIREAVRGYDWSAIQGSLYVVVEKILEPREALPREWPVRGTSGYDFVHFANQVFIQQENAKRFDNLYSSVLHRTSDPDEIIYRAKLLVMQNALASEAYVLTNLLSTLAASNRRARDFTDNILEDAIRETIACFPVYRTYIDDRGQYTQRDRGAIHHAITRAKYRSRDVDALAFDFLEETLLLHDREGDEIDPQELYFALKFQQLTGPVMAKGVEDTSFYIYTRFISSNEVGSSMKSFGLSVETFHAANQERLATSPDTMLATSTHDTKRSEDVRNRLNVLSELVNLWPTFVKRCQRMNARFKTTLEDGRVAPDENEEYLFYQTILGAWPWVMQTAEDRETYLKRVQDYAFKALSEAKVNLSWVNPNEKYMEAVQSFLRSILIAEKQGHETPFVRAINDLLPLLKVFGAINSLAQVVLKATSPGVPDFYQGSELWDLSLVDPDNRRPVDYSVRMDALQHLLEEAQQLGSAAVCRDVLNTLHDGRAKLWTTHRTLSVRNTLPEVFRRGEYLPLTAPNGTAQHLIAFVRRHGSDQVVVAVPRFACTLMQKRAALPLGEEWGDAVLLMPEQTGLSFVNAFTEEKIVVPEDGRVPLRELFQNFPVAVLRSEPRV